MLSELTFRCTSVTAVTSSWAQNDKTFKSSYEVSLQKDRVISTGRDLASCGFIQDAVESNYRRYARSTKLVRRFPELLRLVVKLDDESASQNFSATRDALGVPHPDNALLPRADKHSVPLYFEAAPVHTRGRKQNGIFNGRAFCSYALSLLRALRSTHSTTCENHSLFLDVLLLTEIP